MENNTAYQQPVQQEQESILEDAIDTSAYENTLRKGRNWLYVIAALELVLGIYEYATSYDQTVGLIAFGIDAFIGALFFSLALWSKRKPVVAFTLALAFYLMINVGFMFLDPTNIYKGIIIKIFIVIALVKANKDARQYVATKNF